MEETDQPAFHENARALTVQKIRRYGEKLIRESVLAAKARKLGVGLSIARRWISREAGTFRPGVRAGRAWRRPRAPWRRRKGSS